jgi:hypothetical protein
VIGKEVRSDSGENIGRIVDILVDKGSRRYGEAQNGTAPAWGRWAPSREADPWSMSREFSEQHPRLSKCIPGPDLAQPCGAAAL